MTNALVSIIVPAYNVEKYIQKCLNSIVNQTYVYLEIIIIDDGSSDDTPNIIKKNANLDHRIKFIQQKNQGVSAARNKGIKNATGKYLVQIDSDDVVEKEFIEKLVKCIEKGNSDIVVCGFKTVWPLQTAASRCDKKTISGPDAVRQLLIKQDNLDIVPWNKMYKTSLFTNNNNILYPVGDIHEDTLTTYKIYARAKKITYIDDLLYLYFKRRGSITTSTELKNSLDYKLRAAKEAQIYFAKNKELKDAAEIAELLAYYSFIDAMLAKKIPYKDKYFKWIKDNRERLLRNSFLTKKLKTYLLMTNTKKSMPYRLFRKITL